MTIETLSQAIHNDNPRIRLSAIQSLGRVDVDPHRTISLLIHSLDDDEDGVRSTAITTLSKFGLRAVEALAEHLESREADLVRMLSPVQERIERDLETCHSNRVVPDFVNAMVNKILSRGQV